MAMARRVPSCQRCFRAYLRTSSPAVSSSPSPSSSSSSSSSSSPLPPLASSRLEPSSSLRGEPFRLLASSSSSSSPSPSPSSSSSSSSPSPSPSSSSSKSSSSSSSSSSSAFVYPILHLSSRCRQFSKISNSSNGSSIVPFFDTLALVRKLESQGFDAKQAEAITAAMTDVLNDCLQNVSDSFVSKSELQQFNLMQEGAYEKLQTDAQSSHEKKISSIHRDTEKLRIDIEKLQTELRYEMDKVTAGQRLDLNLERGRIKEELANRNAETSNLTNRLDKEINTLKTQLEASKYEVIKYCIGTIVSVYALGVALLRIFK